MDDLGGRLVASVCLLGLAGFAVVLTRLFLGMLVPYWTMNLRGITVPGTVRVRVPPATADNPSTYQVTVVLTRRDGRVDEMKVKDVTLDRFGDGARVRVRYDPRSKIEARRSDWRPGKVLLTAFVMVWLHYFLLLSASGVLFCVWAAIASILGVPLRT